MNERPSQRFWFRLCLALGFPHPDHLRLVLTSQQAAEWEAYAKVEPFGYPIDAFRFGQLCATVANFSFGSKKRNYMADDFSPQFKPPEKDSLSKKLLEFFKGIGAKKQQKTPTQS